jgi:hypothetical protein
VGKSTGFLGGADTCKDGGGGLWCCDKADHN